MKKEAGKREKRAAWEVVGGVAAVAGVTGGVAEELVLGVLRRRRWRVRGVPA